MSDPQGGVGLFDPSGGALLYLSKDAVKRVTTTDAKTTTLVPSGCLGLEGISPDGKTLVYDAVSPSPSGTQEFDAISTTIPGALRTLLAPYSFPWYVTFTRDSSHVLFPENSNGTGGIRSAPTQGGVPLTLWTSYSSLRSLRAQKVLIEDDSQALRVLDASGGAPALAATNVTSWSTSPDGNWIAYATSANPPGLYLVAVP
jgi:hypothetical protein